MEERTKESVNGKKELKESESEEEDEESEENELEKFWREKSAQK